MTYFTQDFITFFRNLSENNNTTWFHSHKKEYEACVKNPMKQLVTDVINRIREGEPDLTIETKDCILRINKDMRFSRDKKPYKTYTTAFISRRGKRDKSYPGIFIRFSPAGVGIMVGCRSFTKESLNNLRHSLIDNADKYKSLVNEAEFKKLFGEVQGEKMKRVPHDLKPLVEKEPLILYKQMYFVAGYENDFCLQENLLDEIMSHWYAAKPVNEFLRKCARI